MKTTKAHDFLTNYTREELIDEVVALNGHINLLLNENEAKEKVIRKQNNIINEIFNKVRDEAKEEQCGHAYDELSIISDFIEDKIKEHNNEN